MRVLWTLERRSGEGQPWLLTATCHRRVELEQLLTREFLSAYTHRIRKWKPA